ncbi:hypothetical protein AAVH_37218 [Aphelenchoides avenae]|nr:hypothetical protein AAVH_37218 [Aphelenchus avenae]
MALVVLFVGGTAFMWYCRRPARPFSAALHFDNPIYRRTVENLDTEDGSSDTSLGVVHLQPSGLASEPASRLL